MVVYVILTWLWLLNNVSFLFELSKRGILINIDSYIKKSKGAQKIEYIMLLKIIHHNVINHFVSYHSIRKKFRILA